MWYFLIHAFSSVIEKRNKIAFYFIFTLSLSYFYLIMPILNTATSNNDISMGNSIPKMDISMHEIFVSFIYFRTTSKLLIFGIS